MSCKIQVGVNKRGIFGLPLPMACRHGLISGATGTGKTVTLRTIAEGFSDKGVPIFLADMKGDLSGMCNKGNRDDFVQRAKKLGVKDYSFTSYPCCYWDIYKNCGLPISVTIKELGSTLLARILRLTRVQCGVLDLIFRIAEDKKYKLNTIEDLSKLIRYINIHTEDFLMEYGTIYPSSLGAILRAVVGLEQQGGDKFFSDNTLPLDAFMQKVGNKGVINIMECEKLVRYPVMYSTFIIWLLDKLYNELPEVGDLDKPKMVLFFDEAHLLFEDTNKVVLNKIAQTVRLIRSKGVGIYLISQSPSDLPDKVLSQLSNRVQHSLRAFTPDEQRAVKTVARTFRINPEFNTEDCIMELGVGECLISFLENTGIPQMVERVNIIPPKSDLNIVTGEFKADYNKTHCAEQIKLLEGSIDTQDYSDISFKRTSSNNNVPQHNNYVGMVGKEVAKSLFSGLFRGFMKSL